MPRPRLGQRDEFLEIFCGQCRMNHQYVGAFHAQHHRREIALQIKRHFRHHRDVNRTRRAGKQHGVAVRWRLHHKIGAYVGIAARTVIDHELLAQRLGEFGADGATGEIRVATGNEGHYDPHGFHGIILRLRDRGRAH